MLLSPSDQVEKNQRLEPKLGDQIKPELEQDNGQTYSSDDSENANSRSQSRTKIVEEKVQKTQHKKAIESDKRGYSD